MKKKVAKKKVKGLWTDKDRQGLAEKKGLNMGSLFSAEDKKGLAEKKGLNIGSLLSEKDKKDGLL